MDDKDLQTTTFGGLRAPSYCAVFQTHFLCYRYHAISINYKANQPKQSLLEGAGRPCCGAAAIV